MNHFANMEQNSYYVFEIYFLHFQIKKSVISKSIHKANKNLSRNIIGGKCIDLPIIKCGE